MFVNGYGLEYKLPPLFSISAESFATWSSLVMKAVLIIKDFEGEPVTEETFAKIQHKLDNMVYEAKTNYSIVLISYETPRERVFKEFARFLVTHKDGTIQLNPIWEDR